MARKQPAKRHSVKVNMKVFELSKRGTALSFEIHSKKEKIGTLKVGRGSLE